MKYYLGHIKSSFILITGICLFSVLADNSVAQDPGLDDSIRVRELLILDTVKLEIYGPSKDVAFYLNGLVFLSNSKYHHTMPPGHLEFGQVTSYLVPLEYIALESGKPLFSNDPFPYPPAGTCYSRDYQEVYFTKTVELSGKRKPEKIFETSIVNGEVSVYNQLSFTAGSTRYLHPALSTDGELLVLASDLTPSSGGLDLFIVKKNVSGWMTPVNMGPEINSSGHEWYPFLDQHNNLFFSSSGHMGYGGYDLYVCFFNGEGWDSPQNLGDLVNTTGDEYGFSIHPNRKLAVYTTNSGENDLQAEVERLSLNNSAFVLAGIDMKNQDLSLLLRDMLRTGYTSAKFGAASEIEVEAGYKLTSLPLLSEQEEEPEPEQVISEPLIAPVVIIAEEAEEEPEPVLVVPTAAEETEEPVAEEPAADANRVIFRVQILSNSRANTQPSVTIAGRTYATWEYLYKGAYRITVGNFENVQEASDFSKVCRNSGFNQAFVAAFRGETRETDPSVFQR